MPSFSPSRLSLASWPTTSLSTKCQRAASALSSPRQLRALLGEQAWLSGFFSRVAARLLCMQPTACACERNWSAWGQLYTKLRSKMAVERARKLVYMHSNGKESGKEREDMDLCLNLPKEEA